MGVTIRYGATITSLRQEGGRIAGVGLAGGEVLTADRYVAAMGSYTPMMLKPLGIEIPVYPVKGYSLTLPVTNAEAARSRP